MTLPSKPDRPRRFPPPPPRRSSRDRLRHIVRRHEAFDPERRGTWRGSARDFVANSPRELRGAVVLFIYDDELREWQHGGEFDSVAEARGAIAEEAPGTECALAPSDGGVEATDTPEPISTPELKMNPAGFRADLEELVHDYYGKLRTDLTEDEVVTELLRLFKEEDSDDALRAADELLEGHGVEALGPVNARDGAPYLYINFGDPYAATIMYSRDDNKIFVAKGGWGDVWQDEGEPNAHDEAWDSYLASEFRRGVTRELQVDPTLEALEDAFSDLSSEQERELFDKALYEAQNAPGNSRKYPEWVESFDGYSLMHLDVVVDKAAELLRGGWQPGRLTTNPSVRRRGQNLDFHHDETTGVLAGAYRGRRNDFEGYRTHTVFCDSEGRQIGVACRQPLDNMADTYSASDAEKALPPTCPTCLRTWKRLHGSHTENKGSRLDQILDQVESGKREVTIDAEGYTPEQIERVKAEAKARGLHVSGTRRWLLIRDLRGLHRNGDLGDIDVFIKLLYAKLNIGDRRVVFKTGGNLGGPSASLSLFVNFINLPADVGSAGGGAEAENNRMSFSVYWGPTRQGPYASDKPIPEGKVRIEQRVSALPREYRLRAKTGAPAQVASYLAEFLNLVAREVPPKFTHTSR